MLRLKQLADAVGLITTLVFTLNPGGQDEGEAETGPSDSGWSGSHQLCVL